MEYLLEHDGAPYNSIMDSGKCELWMTNGRLQKGARL